MATPRMYVYFVARSTEELRSGVKIDKQIRKGKGPEGTVNDPKLGSFEPDQVCETCGETRKCLGHQGYIDLPEPCFNPNYAEAVIGVLHCICLKCKSPRISLLKEERTNFFKYLERAKPVGMCGKCGAPLPKFSFSKPKDTGYSAPSIQMSYPSKIKRKTSELKPIDVLSIFKRITDETLEVIGFNSHVTTLEEIIKPLPNLDTHGKISLFHFRPEDMITEVLPVLPTTARPRVLVGSDLRYDDMTEAYNKIVKLVTQAQSQDRLDEASLKKYESITGKIQSEYWRLAAPAPKNGKSSGVRAVKSIPDRIGGKDGRKTSNVAGKRADFTSRTVGSPGGSGIPFGCLGYPKAFAKKLTQPELVCDWNFDWASDLVEKGKVNIVLRGERKIVVSRVCKGGAPFIFNGEEGLKLGDVIARQLMDGDSVFLNRQPTLKDSSIQGVTVKLVDEVTHQLPLASCRPLNADFDGDVRSLQTSESMMPSTGRLKKLKLPSEMSSVKRGHIWSLRLKDINFHK